MSERYPSPEVMLCCRVPLEFRRRLRIVALTRGLSMAQIVREAIERLLTDHPED